jgi:hypothetical protein
MDGDQVGDHAEVALDGCLEIAHGLFSFWGSGDGREGPREVAARDEILPFFARRLGAGG